jgi:hypothetical protein
MQHQTHTYTATSPGNSMTEPTGGAAEESATYRTLTARDREMFANFRIPHSLLTSAGVRRVTDYEAREKWGFDNNSATADLSGIAFPYYAPETGHRISVRIRRDNPEIDADDKLLDKYKSAYGDQRRFYWPPKAWEELQNDPKTPFAIVEAEKSALAMMAWALRTGRNLVVVAMGGCWNFRRTRRKRNEHDVEVDQKTVLFDLNYCAGRVVYVLFDTNVRTNQSVQAAERSLKSELKKRGCKVLVCRLPQVDGVNGPDDYLALTSDEAMAKVFDYADPVENGLDPSDPRTRIELSRDGRELAEVAKDISVALRGTLYTHGDDVVEPRGALLRQVRPQEFRTWIAGKIACVRWKEKQQVIVTMSEGDARGVLSSPQIREQLQPIERVNTCRLPVMREDGQIVLLCEGYDEKTRTLTVSEVDYREDMSLEEAKTLLCDDFFSEFEFIADDDGRSLSVAIAFMVGLYVTHLLPARTLRPCGLVTKNAEGAGATTMVLLITTAVLGNVPFYARPGTDDEMRKLLTSVVHSGAQSLVFDNIGGHLKSPALEAFLTAPQWSDRQLGGNQIVSGLNLATVLITGNGLTISPDLARRSLIIELHQSFERPGERQYRKHLDAATLHRRRRELLAALWALVCHWSELSSETKKNLPTKSNSAFPEWSHTIGGIVEAAGFTCPLTPSRSDSAIVDEEGTHMRVLVEAMNPGEKITAAEMRGLCREKEIFQHLVGASVEEVTPKLRSSFGKLLQRYESRFVGDMHFRVEGVGHKRRYWVENARVKTHSALTSAGKTLLNLVDLASRDESTT